MAMHPSLLLATTIVHGHHIFIEVVYNWFKNFEVGSPLGSSCIKFTWMLI